MKLAVLPVLAAAGLLSACGSDPDPWLAYASVAAAAQPGAAALVASHASMGEDCAVEVPPALEIVTQGTQGVATIGETTETIVAPDLECDGQPMAASAVFYEAPAGATGFDRIVYRELRRPAAPDVLHTAEIRIR